VIRDIDTGREQPPGPSSDRTVRKTGGLLTPPFTDGLLLRPAQSAVRFSSAYPASTATIRFVVQAFAAAAQTGVSFDSRWLES